MAIDRIKEIESIDQISEVEKFNPYHDNLGRFSDGSGAGAAHFTIQTKNPAHQHWADMAIARAQGKIPPTKAKTPKTTTAAPKQNTTDPSKPNWVNTEQSGHKKMPSGMNKTAVTADRCKVSGERAEEINRAVNDFSVMGYSAIRKAAIGKNGDPERIKQANDIEEFIQRSPKWDGGNLHRGISVDRETANRIFKQAMNGETMDMQGMSSWSSDVSIARKNFASVNSSNKSGVSIIFHTNSTSSKYGTSIMHLSDFKSEKEVLLSKDARYKATKVKKMYTKSGRSVYNIYVDEI